MRNVVLVVIGLVLSCGIANATVPDPGFCSVEPCDTINGVITCPYEGSGPAPTEFVCNIRNGDNDPIPNAYVELFFGTPGNHCQCASIVLTGTTDALGNVTFNVAAGGCTMGANSFRIRANNVDIRAYENCKSPDWDGTANCGVLLADFTVLGNAFVAGAPGCTDYDNNGLTELPDFTIFAMCWARTCTP